MHQLQGNTAVRRAISPVAIGTTGTGQNSQIIDRQGFGGVEFIIAIAAITATAAVFTATVLEGDATGSLTSAADADLIGTEAAAGIAAGARTDGVGDHLVKRVGYKGTKRYVRLNYKSTATAGPIISAVAELFNPEVFPTV